ncbi:unnamed protein product [Clonostachys rosea]|uniref:Cytochrome b5 heme-binding domain-containing protein n=1 Tax=Bionectria ochroleuca TaxID=29856 RepID=A0ABY6TV58_BIOOC|nr:unnamed protein product [Clonostachys rosea]
MSKSVEFSELAKHNSVDDLWIAVNGKVYDVTKFAQEHPGGPDVIYEYGGSDASSTYNEAHGPSLITKALDAKFHVGSIDPKTSPKKPEIGTKELDGEKRKSEERPSLDSIINLDDFERAATKSLSEKAIAFIGSGSNDNFTRDANRSALNNIWLRPRVMKNVKTVSTATTLFGAKLELPVYISPTGGARTGGAEGELTLARGAAAGGIIHCFATPSSYPYDEILDATPQQALFQLYVNKDRAQSEAAIRQMDASGKVKAILVTVDTPIVSKREADERVKSNEVIAIGGVKTTVTGADKKGGGLARQSSGFIDPSVDWSIIPWLRGLTSLPVLVKGIQTAADARIAHSMGCDGIVLSNHGGRAADHAPPAILILLELQKHCPEVLSSMEVLVDGGFRRGADIVKAICLGASAVGLGRSFLFSLSYGQQGVERIIESKFLWIFDMTLVKKLIILPKVLRDEIETAMRLCGMTDLMRDAHPRFINTNRVDQLIPEEEHPYARKIVRDKSRL